MDATKNWRPRGGNRRAPANKGKRYPAELLSAEEVQAIMAAMPARGRSGPRNRALLVVLWRSGLRISEALALLPKDVDLGMGTITVLGGKGAKRRMVVIDPHAVTYLQAWARIRDTLGVDDAAPLFCTITNDNGGPGRPVKDSCVREMLKRYARKAGITKRVLPALPATPPAEPRQRITTRHVAGIPRRLCGPERCVT